jgi:hypothetical protein
MPSTVTLPLTSVIKGVEVVPRRSGLNWGQRPGRASDQAYLSVPSEIQRLGFFPAPGVPFIIETDDGLKLKCVRSQSNGKAIESQENNALLGSYFRSRLGIGSGHIVTLDHLLHYGRTSVDIEKISEYWFKLDFSAH